MSHAIHYKRVPCNLKAVAHSTCPAGFAPDVYENLLLGANPTVPDPQHRIASHKPIILPNVTTEQQHVTHFAPLAGCTREQHKVLSGLSEYAGGGAVMGLASLLWDVKVSDTVGDLITFGGNGMGAGVASSNAVLAAIDHYDRALNAYEDLKVHRAAPRMQNAGKLRADAAFHHMNNILAQKSYHYLNSAEFKMLATTNAAGRDVWRSIPVRDQLAVQKLASLAKAGRVLGPGVILLDGYIRANKVHHMRAAGDPGWQRERFIQTGAFAGGILAGAIIGLTITFIPGGLLIAFVAGGVAGIMSDRIIQERLGAWYDRGKR